MADLLDLIYQYRRLLVRQEILGNAFGEDGQERLANLEKLFGKDPEDTGAVKLGLPYTRRHARCDVKFPATVQMGRRVHPVDVVNLGGGGLRVEPAPPLRQGERAVVRIVSMDSGAVYQYPVEASWTDRGPGSSAMGMPFVGAPRVLPLAS